MSSTFPHNMVNFGPLAAEIDPVVWAPLQISTGFAWLASWQRYYTAFSSGRWPNFAALKRGRHLCSAGRPSYWALAHILVILELQNCPLCFVIAGYLSTFISGNMPGTILYKITEKGWREQTNKQQPTREYHMNVKVTHMCNTTNTTHVVRQCSHIFNYFVVTVLRPNI